MCHRVNELVSPQQSKFWCALKWSECHSEINRALGQRVGCKLPSKLTGVNGSSGADAPAQNLRVKMSKFTAKAKDLRPDPVSLRFASTGSARWAADRHTDTPAVGACMCVRACRRERERERWGGEPRHSAHAWSLRWKGKGFLSFTC